MLAVTIHVSCGPTLEESFAYPAKPLQRGIILPTLQMRKLGLSLSDGSRVTLKKLLLEEVQGQKEGG